MDRSSGLLLHITSLPGPWGVGDLGPEAYRFADFLASAGQSIWQVLPMGPVGSGNSPYSSPSTFAWSELFVSPDGLVDQGLLPEKALELAGRTAPGDKSVGNRVAGDLAAAAKRVDYRVALDLKARLTDQAFEHYKHSPYGKVREEFEQFRLDHSDWLRDYALFVVLERTFESGDWASWPREYRDRDEERLTDFATEHHLEIMRVEFGQFLVQWQWDRLREYCVQNGIRLFGDCPIYVAQESADVWAHRDLFDLDDEGRPRYVAGVPPDYFSETGQRWGNPLYLWDRMRENGFDWWARRMARAFGQFDAVRLDHFRGFSAYWSVPADEETAMNGEWMPGPGAEFFRAILGHSAFPIVSEDREESAPLVIAEDLGQIDHDVRSLMAECGFPGMAVLQFGFDTGPSNEYLPHNYVRNLVAYTGTHDNDTFMGWMGGAPFDEAQQFALAYLEARAPGFATHQQAIVALMDSVADWVIFPVQDVLGLGAEARMNTPGEAFGNWEWRLDANVLTEVHASWLLGCTRTFGRLPSGGMLGSDQDQYR